MLLLAPCHLTTSCNFIAVCLFLKYPVMRDLFPFILYNCHLLSVAFLDIFCWSTVHCCFTCVVKYLNLHYSECGLQTSNAGINWKLGRNAEYWAPPAWPTESAPALVTSFHVIWYCWCSGFKVPDALSLADLKFLRQELRLVHYGVLKPCYRASATQRLSIHIHGVTEFVFYLVSSEEIQSYKKCSEFGCFQNK